MKILIADDDKRIREAIRFSLLDSKDEVDEVGTIAELNSLIQKNNYDLLILDIHFPDGSGIEFYKKMKVEYKIDIPTLCISGAATASEAAAAVKYGVFDYLEKPISIERLKTTIYRLQQHQLWVQSTYESVMNNSDLSNFIIGESPFIKKLRKDILNYATKDFKVLITGETGTGKEVVAKSLWGNSKRNKKPLVSINAAAIPESLFESELFGHKKGSFTGALTDKLGKVSLAHQGTLFIDELGDLSLHSQVKLLRFLESGEIQKVGSLEEEKVDVKVIAATSKDLLKEMNEGRFRSDLFYRLNLIQIHLLPLRDRKEDVIPLIYHFMKQCCLKYELNFKQIDDEGIDYLLNYQWPGNIRELKNCAEKMAILDGTMIRKNDISSIHPMLQSTLNQTFNSHSASVDSSFNFDGLTYKEFRARSDFHFLNSILKKTEGNISEAARLLNLDRSTLHQKIKDLKIQN